MSLIILWLWDLGIKVNNHITETRPEIRVSDLKKFLAHAGAMIDNYQIKIIIDGPGFKQERILNQFSVCSRGYLKLWNETDGHVQR